MTVAVASGSGTASRSTPSGFVGDVVPVPDRPIALVGLTRVRRSHHGDVARVGIVCRDVALQLMNKRAMWLIPDSLGPSFGVFAAYRELSGITSDLKHPVTANRRL